MLLQKLLAAIRLRVQGQLLFHHLHPGHGIQHRLECLAHFAVHIQSGVQLAVLFQIAQHYAVHNGQFSGVRLVFPAQHPQKRGFTRAVFAHNANAVALFHIGGNSFEDHGLAEILFQILQPDQHRFLLSPPTVLRAGFRHSRRMHFLWFIRTAGIFCRPTVFDWFQAIRSNARSHQARTSAYTCSRLISFSISWRPPGYRVSVRSVRPAFCSMAYTCRTPFP